MKGWEYALQNPDEAVSATMKYAKGNYADIDYEDYIMHGSIPLIRGHAKTLGEMNIIPWSILYEAMKKSGVITENYNIREIYTNDFIYK